MKSIWLWVLVPTALFFYVAFQLASISSRITTLEDRVMRMELRWANEGEPSSVVGADASSVAPVNPTVRVTAKPDGDELATLRAEVQALKAAVGPASENRIREVVARQQDEVVSRQLDFQQEQWIAARDGGLAKFASDARLSPEQRNQIKDLLDTEAERVVDLLRQRSLREDPERLAAAWDEVLAGTDYEARHVLLDWQQERWEEARAFERAVFLPFLPR